MAAAANTETPPPLPRLDETQYLSAVQTILTDGFAQEDRTGVGTLTRFGVSLRFNLRGGVMPLLTTKRVFWRGVVEELLWFLSGSTSSKALTERGVRIWDANGSKEFLAGRGLTDREEGDLGPVYGFQWRHFGASYGSMRDDYTDQGVDQIAAVIKALREDPSSRRIILSAWNVADLDKMALPPCHFAAQFLVSPSRELTCILSQRSGDMGLGVPFNIASYALLTHMLAHVTDLMPGEVVLNIGNAHVYTNHIAPLRTQLERTPYAPPTLRITRETSDIHAITADDIVLEGYKCHPRIPMDMAV